MPDALLVVESRPASPEQEGEFHSWYEDVHFPEILAVEGFVSARRYPDRQSGSWVAVYEVEGDVPTVRDRLHAALPGMARPVGVLLDPPPTMRWLG